MIHRTYGTKRKADDRAIAIIAKKVKTQNINQTKGKESESKMTKGAPIDASLIEYDSKSK